MTKVGILAICLVGAYLFFSWKLTTTFVSDDYSKFTHETPSLILGLSREHYGLDPETVDRELSEVNYEGPFQNFAFEKSQSPYGEVYLHAILEKLPSQTMDGIFILGVSPGSFSAANRLKTPEEILEFDSGTMLGKMTRYNSDPNLEFVRKCYGRSLYKGLFPHDHRVTSTFHENGWEEFRLYGPGYEITAEDIRYWQDETVKGYTKLAGVIPEHISSYRLEWFSKTIDSLQKHGRVFLLRVPMHRGVLALEDQVWPSFDRQMDSIALLKSVPYLNYRDRTEEFETYDGSHLHSESAKAFSRDVARTIKDYIGQRAVVEYLEQED